MNKKYGAVSALAMAGLAGWLAWSGGTDEPETVMPAGPQSIPVAEPPVVTETTPPLPEDPAEVSTPEPFAQSLRGTHVDGELQVDEAGNLKVTRETRDLFDYFLSAVGQRSLEEVIEHIEQYAQHNLPEQAAAQAIALLDGYVRYHQAAQTHLQHDLTTAQQNNQIDTLESTLTTLMRLRRQYLGHNSAEAFFGPEEAYGRHVLDRMQAGSDPRLTEQQREARLAEIDAQAPPEIIAVRERTTGHVYREQRVEEMRSQGASEAEVTAFRASHSGEEEARRMAAIDAANSRWEQQYQRYAQERSQIESTQGLSARDKASSIERLRAQYFEGTERARAEVRDRAQATRPDS